MKLSQIACVKFQPEYQIRVSACTNVRGIELHLIRCKKHVEEKKQEAQLLL